MIRSEPEPEILPPQGDDSRSGSGAGLAAVWSVYMVCTRDGYYYTGISTDPERRFREHCRSGRRAARFFRGHPPEALVFKQQIGSRSLASKVEYHLKQAPASMKQRIAASGRVRYNSSSGEIRSPSK